MRKASGKRAIAAWCLYDWSATPFHSVINTFVFSVWFASAVYGDEQSGGVAWAYVSGFAGLAVALASPIAGAIADNTGRRMPWIAALTLLNVAACAGLWFVLPHRGSAGLALGLMALATIGGELALVFYNAILPGLAAQNRIGFLSGLGWGCGYMGGLAALVLVLFGLVLPHDLWFGVTRTDGANIRMTGPLTGLWALLFAWPLFAFVRDGERKGPGYGTAVRMAFGQLRNTIRQARQYRNIVWFLIASALYRDGLNTLFAVGGLYAAHSFGMTQQQVLVFAIGIEVSAVIGCLGFGYLDDKVGAKATIALSLAGILVTGLALVLIDNREWFTPIGLVMGLFIGPAQSSGRSMMARLAPPEIMTEMFGLYQFAGKSVSFFGPIAFATVTSLFSSQRAGMVTILLFILAGLAVLTRVDDRERQQ